MRYATHTKDAGSRGNTLVAVLVFSLMIAGMAIPTMLMGVRTSQSTSAAAINARLLMAAESGLGYCYLELEQDALYAVKDELGWDWNAADGLYEQAAQSLRLTGAAQAQPFRLRVQYLKAGVPVEFSDRTNPDERYDSIKVMSSASMGGLRQTAVAWYEFRFAFNAAIVSDSIPNATGGKGKTMAKKGHIVIDGNGNRYQHAIFGDLESNGEIVFFDDNKPVSLTSENAQDYMLAYEGSISANLAGTANEIPDFTNPASQKQLFDFDRFEALAAHGGGKIYNNLSEFESAVRDANSRLEPLEGVIVVKIDPAVEGNAPKLQDLTIQVNGTLLFDFADGTHPDYKVVIDKSVAVKINAANVIGIDLQDEQTWTTGYPPTYEDPEKQPYKVDITADGFDNFEPTDDMPAVMFNNGIVDFHGAVNICGVVYGPAFIEIENKDGNLQYFNGAVFGGGGVFLEAYKGGDGTIAIRHDRQTIDELPLFDQSAAKLTRVGYAITQ